MPTTTTTDLTEAHAVAAALRDVCIPRAIDGYDDDVFHTARERRDRVRALRQMTVHVIGPRTVAVALPVGSIARDWVRDALRTQVIEQLTGTDVPGHDHTTGRIDTHQNTSHYTW